MILSHHELIPFFYDVKSLNGLHKSSPFLSIISSCCNQEPYRALSRMYLMTSFSIFHSLLDDCGVEKTFCLKSVKCQYHKKCQRISIFGLDPISDSTCKLKHLSLQTQKAMHGIIIFKIKIKIIQFKTAI